MAKKSPSARRYLALFFPFWATDWLRQADPGLDEKRPLALYEKRNNAMRLVAVDARAHALGLRSGQSLADAQPLCSEGVFLPIDQAATLEAFEKLADWHDYVSPIVAIHSAHDPYGDLLIDITGTTHLWRGEDRLLQHVHSQMNQQGFSVQGAIAQSPGAAWALARFLPGQVLSGDIASALAGLPVTALRLEDEVVTGLMQMGLKTIGALYGRNRRALAARYGHHLLLRLDQALGEVEERIVPRRPAPQYWAEQRFAEPLSEIDPLLQVIDALAGVLCMHLERGGHGAQTLRVQLFRVDHQVMTLSVQAARATRDPAHIARLFAHRIDRLRDDFDAGFGIEMVRLEAVLLAHLASAQDSVLTQGDNGVALMELYDRLTSRLGENAVLGICPMNSFLPEQAVRLQPIGQAQAEIDLPQAVLGPRPLRLLRVPEAVRVLATVPDGPPVSMVWRHRPYRFARASGPERISSEWWHADAVRLDRDYYRVEDEKGRRFWLFRQGSYRQTQAPQWFIHGLFA